MKRTMILFSFLLILTLVLGIAIIGCGEILNEPKSITITGINGKNGLGAYMEIYTRPGTGDAIEAIGTGLISDNAVTLELFNFQIIHNESKGYYEIISTDPWTGNGNHILKLVFEDDPDRSWLFTNGVDVSIDQLRADPENWPKYNITNSNSIPFNLFWTDLSF